MSSDKSPSFSLNNGARPCQWEDEGDLYFEMEFPVINRSRASTAEFHGFSSPDSFGSRSTLDSRESPSRDSRESSGPRETSSTPREFSRERPNTLNIPAKGRLNRSDGMYCSLPRTKVHKVPKLSFQNFSVPTTPADMWERSSSSSYVEQSGYLDRCSYLDQLSGSCSSVEEVQEPKLNQSRY